MKSRGLSAGVFAGSIMLAGGSAYAQQPVQMVQPDPQPVMVAQAPMPMPTPGVTIVPDRDGRPAPVQIAGPMPGGCAMTPCQVSLSPGSYNLTVLGPGGFNRGFDLHGLPATIEYRQRRVGRLVVGAIELGFGAPFAVAGLALTGYGIVYSGVLGGWILLIPGVICLAIGIPLTIVGALNVASSGASLVVRPGGMMVGSRERRRNGFGAVMGMQRDSESGGVYQTFGFSF